MLAFEGTLAAVAGDHDHAKKALQEAAMASDDDTESRTAIYASYQLGRLVGGSDGQRLLQNAAERLRSQGIANPERWVDLHLGRLRLHASQ